MSTRYTQCQKIVDYMTIHGSITSLEAIQKLRCLRLASRIHDLKEGGYVIDKEMESYESDTGEVTRYARYYLIQRP